MRETRIDARLPAETKQRIEHAAAIKGMSLTDFIIEAAVAAATKIVQEDERMVLRRSEARAFVALHSIVLPPAGPIPVQNEERDQ